MTASSLPTATRSPLPLTDGSATFSQNGYTVLAAINGPLEVARHNELPSEAFLDVLVRPASGVGGTRERHLETILHSTLRQLILTPEFPRALIQITLQVTQTPENDSAAPKLNQAAAALPLLPALLHASTLALLSAGTPLRTSLTATLIAISTTGKLTTNPSPRETALASSLHVLGFTAAGELLVAESEGKFGLREWQGVCAAGREVCTGGGSEDEGVGEMAGFVRGVVRERGEEMMRWRA